MIKSKRFHKRVRKRETRKINHTRRNNRLKKKYSRRQRGGNPLIIPISVTIASLLFLVGMKIFSRKVLGTGTSVQSEKILVETILDSVSGILGSVKQEADTLNNEVDETIRTLSSMPTKNPTVAASASSLDPISITYYPEVSGLPSDEENGLLMETATKVRDMIENLIGLINETLNISDEEELDTIVDVLKKYIDNCIIYFNYFNKLPNVDEINLIKLKTIMYVSIVVFNKITYIIDKMGDLKDKSEEEQIQEIDNIRDLWHAELENAETLKGNDFFNMSLDVNGNIVLYGL